MWNTLVTVGNMQPLQIIRLRAFDKEKCLWDNIKWKKLRVWSQFYKNSTKILQCLYYIYIFLYNAKGNFQNLDSGSLSPVAWLWVILIFFFILYSLNFLPWTYITYFLTILIWNISYIGKNVYNENMICSIFRIIKK